MPTKNILLKCTIQVRTGSIITQDTVLIHILLCTVIITFLTAITADPTITTPATHT